jgi:murein DD-endopeptidase MepM/ murein hydrolase activator NlpD
MRTVFRAGLLILLLVSLAVPTTSTAVTTGGQQQLIQELKFRIEELQRRQDAILGDISQTQAQKATLQKEINALLGQIKYVENQIASTDTKIELNQAEQEDIAAQIEATRAEMSRKRESIGRLVLYLQQRDQEDMVASLFKFADLSSFLRQLDDAASVQERLLGLISDLKESKAILESDQTTLEEKQHELESLQEQAELKRSQLLDVKTDRDKTLKATKGQEATYQQQLAAVEDAKAKLFAELLALEPQVIAGGLYLIHVTATSVPAPGTKLFRWPKECRTTTQGYGMTAYASSRKKPYGGLGHNGIDIACGFGSPNLSIGDGQVIANGKNTGWGNWVAVRHENSMVSLYAHMNSLSAKATVGTRVKAGDVLGYEGKTGYATGSHLHLSLYKDYFTFLKGDELYFNYWDGTLRPTDYLQ